MRSAHSTATPRRRSTAAGRSTTRHRTPSGSVQRRPGRVPGRKPEQHRAREVARAGRRMTSRAVGGRRRLVAAAHLAEDERPRARRACPLWRSCVSMRSIRYGRSFDVLEKQHAARRAGRTRTACPATPPAASACRRRAGRPPRRARSASSPSGAQLASRRRRRAQRHERRLVVAGGARARAGPRASGHEAPTRPQLARQPRQKRRDVAVPDEQLRARRGLAASSSGSSCTLPYPPRTAISAGDRRDRARRA